MTKLVFEAERTGYSTEQIDRPITVGELINFLQDFNEDTPIYLSHDRGYTYGTLNTWDCKEVEDDEEWEDE